MTIYNLSEKPEQDFKTPTLITDTEFIVFDSFEEWNEYLNNKYSS